MSLCLCVRLPVSWHLCCPSVSLASPAGRCFSKQGRSESSLTWSQKVTHCFKPQGLPRRSPRHLLPELAGKVWHPGPGPETLVRPTGPFSDVSCQTFVFVDLSPKGKAGRSVLWDKEGCGGQTWNRHKLQALQQRGLGYTSGGASRTQQMGRHWSERMKRVVGFLPFHLLVHPPVRYIGSS